jgi:hypothetical protein
LRFIRFLIGGFLILGSLIFGGMLLFPGLIVAAITDSLWILVLLGVVDFIAFLGGIYLVIHH